MRRRWLLAMVAVAFPFRADADPAPSVLVQTAPATQGSIPDTVVAYGTVGPSVDGGLTLSLQQDGRVIGIAVTPGELVHRGDHLIEFGPSAAAASTYQQAVSAVALARTERAHTAQLLAQQLATRDQLAQADKAQADAQAALDALRREGAGQAVQSLLAPFDGIVASIPVAQGDRVAPGTALITLTRLDGLVVTVGVEPAVRLRLQPGQPTQLDRLQPGSGPQTLQTKLARVDAVLNPKTRLLDADVVLPPGAAVSGEAFRATIEVGQIRGWAVKRDAVLVDGKGAYLFQVENDKAVRVDVMLSGSTAATDVVQGPLDPSRPVVVQGAAQLDDGAAVRVDPQRS